VFLSGLKPFNGDAMNLHDTIALTKPYLIKFSKVCMILAMVDPESGPSASVLGLFAIFDEIVKGSLKDAHESLLRRYFFVYFALDHERIQGAVKEYVSVDLWTLKNSLFNRERGATGALAPSVLKIIHMLQCINDFRWSPSYKSEPNRMLIQTASASHNEVSLIVPPPPPPRRAGEHMDPLKNFAPQLSKQGAGKFVFLIPAMQEAFDLYLSKLL